MSKERLSDNWFSDKRMSDTESAHFAGFLDGEGTLTISAQAKVDNRIGYRFRPCMTVVNTDVEALEELRRRCGNGSIVSHRLREKQMPCFTLRFTADQIRHVLPQLVPYLLVKRRQADILLAFMDLSVNWKWHQHTQEEWDTMHDFRVRICSLNQRGSTPKVFERPVMRASKLGNNQFQQSRN